MRGSGRNLIPNDRSRPKKQPDTSELQKSVKELEKQLHEKDICLARNAERLKRNYGLEVSLDKRRSRSRSPIHPSISPVRLGAREIRQDRNCRRVYNASPPIRVDSPDLYDSDPSRIHRPNRPDNYFEYNGPMYAFEQPPGSNGVYERPTFEQPPSYGNFDSYQNLHYHDEVEVRVDEMPKWPMDGSPSREQQSSFSSSPYWRSQEDVQIEPMPVFPMNGVVEEPPRARKSAKSSLSKHSAKPSQTVKPSLRPSENKPVQSRQEKARMQMRMIAQQAEMTERRAEEEKKERLMEEKRKEREQVEAREKIRKLREKALEDLKKKEMEQRRIEREQRHAQRKKEDEKRRKESSRTREKTRSPSRTSTRKEKSASSSKTDQAESDETLLDLLRPALGRFSCETVRVESSRNGIYDYKTTCHVVNIPKELLIGSYSSRNRDDAHKGAVSDYVKKLAFLGVFEDKFRKLMAQSSKFRRFIASFVEPLCNDIAIFGTQISVTNDSDMKEKFASFSNEKCSEFWNNPDNCEKLSKFMQTNVLGVTPSSSKRPSIYGERSHKVESISQSSTSRRRSPSSDSSIEVVYSTHNNRVPSQDAPIQNQLPSSSSVTVDSKGIGSLPSLMSLPILPPVDVINPYPQPRESYPHQMMSGFQQFAQPNQHYQQPPVPGFEIRQSGGLDDAELMDEIFS